MSSNNPKLSFKSSMTVSAISGSEQLALQGYDEIKLHVSSGVISHINTQLCASFTDFYGFLIGRYKLIKNTESNDLNSDFHQNVLTLVVENVIFIYDKNYIKDKLEKLLEKITKKSTIIGLFSARMYSFPNISLREQQFFFKTKEYMKNISALPLIFGCFCHNVTKETFESKVKTVNFYSRVYMLKNE
jgi:hypothetical protein